MKLYYSPLACSLSPHIVLREAGLPFELVRVDLKTHTVASDGRDFRAIHPKGYVPLLELDDGQLLSEGPAIVQYLADRVPERQLAPANGTLARYRLQEWLGYINSELHKGFSPLFKPGQSEDAKNAAREQLGLRLDFIAAQLGEKPFLLGETFSVADAYLFVIINWGQWVGIDLARWPRLSAFHARVAARDSVRAAIDAEQAK